MAVFDLQHLETHGYEDRGKNVFYENELFKTRIIELEPGGGMPDCRMECFVIFYVVGGEVIVRKNNEPTTLKEDQVFITEPALLSMHTETGARLMGVQIQPRSS